MKTFITNLAVSILLLTNLSGCMEYEFDWGSGWGSGGSYYGGGYSGPGFYPTYYATFYIDSVSQVSDSKVKIWAQIRYDSVLIIENHAIKYLDESGNEISKSIHAPDTIDFRNLSDSTLSWTGQYEWTYPYSIEVDSLKNNFDYSMYVTSTYTEKSLPKLFQYWVYFRLN